MNLQKSEQELISLDRLNTLKSRVLFSIKEYKILLKALKKSFKGSDTDLLDHLQKNEQIKLKTLQNRVKIFKAFIVDLENRGLAIRQIESEVYTEIDRLNLYLIEYQKDLREYKDSLEIEISQVKKRLRPIVSNRDYTAQRIDITT